MSEINYLKCNVCGDYIFGNIHFSGTQINFDNKNCRSCRNFFHRSNRQMKRLVMFCLMLIKRNHVWQIVVLSQLCWSAWNFRCPMFAYQCQCVEKCSGSSITFCNITKETRNSCKQCRYKKCTGKCPCAGNWREEILSLYNNSPQNVEFSIKHSWNAKCDILLMKLFIPCCDWCSIPMAVNPFKFSGKVNPPRDQVVIQNWKIIKKNKKYIMIRINTHLLCLYSK